MIHLLEHRYEYLEEINEGILKQIPDNIEQKVMVLDIGCGSGALGEAIKNKGYVVWGIEENEYAADKAKGRLDNVLNFDLTVIDEIKNNLGSQKFDYIVLSDVLEHLYDPFSVLKEYMCFLKDMGKVVISVPNAVVWQNRLNFLFGKFEYTATGVMDRTHIRFFTFKTTKRLVEAAGCRIEKSDYTPYMIRAFLPLIKKHFVKNGSLEESDRKSIIDSSVYRFYMKYIYSIEYYLGYIFKRFIAFRIIIVGRKL